MEKLLKITRLTKKQLGTYYKDDFIQIEAIINGRCIRCGNIHIKEGVCDNCSEFGTLTIATCLYTMPGNPSFDQYIKVKQQLVFTDLQLKAAEFIIECINKKENGLIWAVCGAGKTEITFLAIEEVLNNGGCICFAIPRVDILYEVAKRMKEFFNGVKIVILNGNESPWQWGQIYVMTTNQLLKFYQGFDLIIVDEVDAYPYEHNIKYDYAVNNSLKSGGVIIYLTATPSKLIKEKELKTFMINRRWHGFDLPVPKFIYMNLMVIQKNWIPLNLHYLIYKRKRPMLWFIGNVSLCIKLCSLIKKRYNLNVTYIHANDQQRRAKVLAFNDGFYDIMISTCILERGVTFSDIDVAVLDASSKIYDQSSLVQIAGRVGRNQKYQDGNVVFFHIGVTKNMVLAKKQIIKMNDLG